MPLAHRGYAPDMATEQSGRLLWNSWKMEAQMPELVFHTSDFDEEYQITSTGAGLIIKATDYHAGPLQLGRNELAKFGLRFEHDHFPQAKNAEPKGVLD